MDKKGSPGFPKGGRNKAKGIYIYVVYVCIIYTKYKGTDQRIKYFVHSYYMGLELAQRHRSKNTILCTLLLQRIGTNLFRVIN